MGWNLRILKHNGENENTSYFSIHEVFYNRKGIPSSYTADAVRVMGENIDFMKDYVEKMKEAFNKPVLSPKDFPN